MRIALPLLLLLLIAGCDALPRDPKRTLDHIQSSKRIRVGLTEMTPPQQAIAGKLVGTIEQRTGARALIEHGAADPLFARLDEGKIDLVVGPFGEDSPWASDVAFGPPLLVSGQEEHRTELKAAVRNGENRWVMLVERASRTVAPGIADQ